MQECPGCVCVRMFVYLIWIIHACNAHDYMCVLQHSLQVNVNIKHKPIQLILMSTGESMELLLVWVWQTRGGQSWPLKCFWNTTPIRTHYLLHWPGLIDLRSQVSFLLLSTDMPLHSFQMRFLSSELTQAYLCNCKRAPQEKRPTQNIVV